MDICRETPEGDLLEGLRILSEINLFENYPRGKPAHQSETDPWYLFKAMLKGLSRDNSIISPSGAEEADAEVEVVEAVEAELEAVLVEANLA